MIMRGAILLAPAAGGGGPNPPPAPPPPQKPQDAKTTKKIGGGAPQTGFWERGVGGRGTGERGTEGLAKFRLYMGLTLLGGLLFLVVKVIEYGDKFSHGLYPSASNFLALYFTLTGLHAIHVIAGMIVNAYLWLPGTRMWRTEPERFTNRVEVAGIYWHFVDLVWIFLFPVLYLL